MQKYRLKISLLGFPVKELHRIIEISGNCTFERLHEKIFEAFDRYDEHMYSFFLTEQDTEDMSKIMGSKEITHPYNLEDMFAGNQKYSSKKIVIDDAELEEKDVFHYWFDFGDDWWHRIRVEAISATKDRRRIARIVKKVGESPEQYPDYEDFDDE